MYILVVNCGSSSIKAAIVEDASGTAVSSALVERIGEADPTLRFNGTAEALGAAGADHASALAAALPRMLAALPSGAALAGVGHRVVHGGDKFASSVRIDDHVEEAIASVSELAPLHNPVNLVGIRAARRLLPDLPHVGVFDTAFHATLPPRAFHYALPGELSDRLGIRRYGFHGTSHGYVARRAAAFLETPLDELRVITCHLGNGSSVSAVERGRSVETSMGLTPLEGLVMGTRSGDVDPGALFYLARREGLEVNDLDTLLNRKSGLAGLSRAGNDLRDIERRAAEGDHHCQLAINVFVHRLRKYIGAYAAIMGGLDVLLFTAGIGENSVLIRHRATQGLEFLGVRLDLDANREARVSPERPVVSISEPHGRCRVLVVATDEQHAIAQETAAVVARARAPLATERAIPVAISARHVHLTQAAVEALFGAGHRLTPRNPLSQPGQFAAEETVTVVGPKRSIEKVRVLGPTRSACQVEISRTDEFTLGIDAPVRASGHVAQSPGAVLRGPAGELKLEEGVICAQRHIHMRPDDATALGVADKDLVAVAIDSQGRDLVFGDVLVRVSESYALELHLDTDEGNAAELDGGTPAVLMPTQGIAHLRQG